MRAEIRSDTTQMDGLPQSLRPHVAMFSRGSSTDCQRTLKSAIDCVGTGLHSGRRATMVLHPAPTGHGIVFRRRDLGCDIPATFDLVVDTRLCTVLDDGVARVSTIEHVMAALAGIGIDNALVTLDGPEPPALDGSAAHFVFLIDCAGIVEQDAPRRIIEVLRPVRVAHGAGFAELHPTAGGFDLSASIDFPAAAIGRQSLSLRLTPDSFRRELASARTFTQAHEVATLRAAGLALGGSLDNAIVVDGRRVLNAGGLRSPDEFVRHKLLDAVGDLALAGAALRARFVGHCSGHGLNNALLRALFADRAAWRFAASDSPGGWSALPLPAAAAAA